MALVDAEFDAGFDSNFRTTAVVEETVGCSKDACDDLGEICGVDNDVLPVVNLVLRGGGRRRRRWAAGKGGVEEKFEDVGMKLHGAEYKVLVDVEEDSCVGVVGGVRE